MCIPWSGRSGVLWPSQRAAIIAASTAWCTAHATPAQGSSAFFSVLGRGRPPRRPLPSSLEALNGVELSLRQTDLFAYLQPVYSYLSVIELGLYEVIGAVQRKVATIRLEAGSAAYEAAYQQELEHQKAAMQARLYPASGTIPVFLPDE